jgi:hypothetical protein
MTSRMRAFRLVPLVSVALLIGGAFPAAAQVDNGNGARGGPAVGDAPPPAVDQTGLPSAPRAVKGVAEEPAPSTVGLAQPGPDGSTVIVKPRPCGVVAHETDGVTTCIGIPAR